MRTAKAPHLRSLRGQDGLNEFLLRGRGVRILSGDGDEVFRSLPLRLPASWLHHVVRGND